MGGKDSQESWGQKRRTVGVLALLLPRNRGAYTTGKTSVRTPSVVLFGIPLLLNLTVCELEYRFKDAVKVWKSLALVVLAYVRPIFRKSKQKIPLSCSHPSYRIRPCLKKSGREYKLNLKNGFFIRFINYI